jgi:hypothetical protein
MQGTLAFRQSDDEAEIVPLNPIRVETALSRYPVHRLAKKGSISIELHEADEQGQTTLHWEVDASRKYGQPGPLAYKVDTLIVNRRIEEASRPIPKVIKLGSLHDICRELGVRGGKPRDNVKKALYQNALAGITAKIRYKLTDGAERNLEAVFTRYSIVFTGEKFPDGRKADAVYILLNDIYMQVINGAQTRPLDYDYLKELPPASQRFYEILSYQVFAALKHNRPRAKLTYSEYCTYAPQTRYLDFDRVKKQMYKVHAPHRKSGYIAAVEFEATADRENKPDWLMLYTPGPKARAEYRTFTKRGGPKLIVVEPDPPAAPEPSELEQELISRGVTEATARELVAGFAQERIRAQVELFDWMKEKRPKKVDESPGGWLVSAVRGDFAAQPPKGFITKAERERREEAERQKRRVEAEAKRRQKEAEAREQATHAKVTKYWNSLSLEDQKKLEAEALEQAEESLAKLATNKNPMAATFLRLIRDTHIRRLLKLGDPPTAAK